MTHASVVIAAELAARPEGTTCSEVAARAGVALRTAQKVLSGMVRQGLLSCTEPPRKGTPRSVYCIHYYRVPFTVALASQTSGTVQAPEPEPQAAQRIPDAPKPKPRRKG